MTSTSTGRAHNIQPQKNKHTLSIKLKTFLDFFCSLLIIVVVHNKPEIATIKSCRPQTKQMDEQSTPLLARPLESVAVSPKRKIVIGVSAVCIIVATTLLFIGHGSSSTASRTAIMSLQEGKTKLQMAKDGLISYGVLAPSLKKELFNDFKLQYEKSYETDEEESMKFKVFQEFLSTVDANNEKEKKAGGGAVHGITPFADISAEEFASRYLTYRPDYKNGRENVVQAVLSKKQTKSHNSGTISWRGKYTSEVSNQGYCGSCWAFATAEQVQSDAVRDGHMDLDDGKLSVQQILDCDSVANGYQTKDMGCTGGDPITAMDYIMKTGGLVMEDTYPYTSYNGADVPYGPLAGTKSSSTDSDSTCKKLKKSYVVTVKKYYQITNEDDMVDYVSSTGPLSVCVDATEWQTYSYGVVTSCGMNVNHCVQISGYNTDGYYIIRNSWGSTWGEQGYLSLVSGKNACGITTEALYTKTSKA